MKIPSRIFRRKFELSVNIEPYNQLIDYLIGNLECNEILVFDPNDKEVFDCNPDDIEIVSYIEENAKLSINIREWLCVACQVVRWLEKEWDHGEENDEMYACYQRNAFDVLFSPLDIVKPVGPGAYFGQIILNRGKIFSGQVKTSNDFQLAFACLIAHELTHVFDAMHFIIPAFLDWETYWTQALAEGSHCKTANLLMDKLRSYIDDYGRELEEDRLRTYWPSYVEEWSQPYYQYFGHA